MAKETKGEVRLIMDGEVVRVRMFYHKYKRRQIINEWINEIRRMKSKKHEYFISIILN
jgi:hypothetical protein